MKFEEHKIEVVLFSGDEAFVAGAEGSNYDLGHLDSIDEEESAK